MSAAGDDDHNADHAVLGGVSEHDMVAVRATHRRQRRGQGGRAVTGDVDDAVLERGLAGGVVAEATGDLVAEQADLAAPRRRCRASRRGPIILHPARRAAWTTGTMSAARRAGGEQHDDCPSGRRAAGRAGSRPA